MNSTDLIRLKIERANKHIDELKSALLAFKNSDPYKISAKRDPQTRKLIYYLVDVQPMPMEIACIAGDTLHNLRGALDHLAYRLFRNEAGNAADAKHVYFPIFDDAAKYQAGVNGKVHGMGQDAIDAIDAVKPYKGGNDTLWRLHRLNNVDKHRLLITVGAAFNAMNIGQHLGGLLPDFFKQKGLPPLPVPDLYMSPADRMFLLKIGDELFIDAPDAEVNEKINFLFDIAFGEPGVVEGDSILETLKGMSDLVGNVVSDFGPLLK
jgi:hypothetical protein